MKIAQKLTLCLVAVTGALFLVGGYRMVAQNFNAALESAALPGKLADCQSRTRPSGTPHRMARRNLRCTPRAWRLPPPCRRRSLPC